MSDEPAAPDGGDLGYELSLRVVLYHEALARKLQLNATEHKVLDLIGRRAPISPGEVTRETRLSHAAVTKITDRLVERGYVRRTPSRRDRRSIELTLTEDYALRSHPSRSGLIRRMNRGNADFSPAELDVVARWLRHAISALTAATQDLDDR